MTRVVADTNICISALMFDGLPGVFLDLALARAFTLISSPALLDELDDTLCAKFAVSGEDLRLIRAKLEGVISLVDPSFRLQVVADDPDDDRVLECAVAGKADCIVSGDRHLLRLGSYQQVPIITVREFLSEIDRGR